MTVRGASKYSFVGMVAGWTDAEMKALIAVWGEGDVQGQLDSVKRNKDIYQRIAAELSEQGWSKSWKQCQGKVKNLMQLWYRYCEIENAIVPGEGQQ